MEIKFLQILPKTGRSITALFEAGDKEVKISITDTLRIIWDINPYKEIELALKQIGKLKIMLVIAKDEDLKDYIFQTYDFKEGDRILKFGEVVEKLQNEILEAEDKKEYCDDLIKRWRESKEKNKTWIDLEQKGGYSRNISSQDLKEFKEITDEIKKEQECWRFLSLEERWEIENE